MLISKVSIAKNFNNLSWQNFTSRVVGVPYGYANEELKNEIDKFEETHSNAKFLGQGLFARAWLLYNGNVVVKESKDEPQAKKANNGFLSEAQSLSLVPKSVSGSQKLVANVLTQRGNNFLITTFVDGKNADYDKNRWTKKHFNSILKTMYELDKAGVYHGDINEGNCMLCEDGRVNLLDYQWAQKFNIWEKTRNDEVFRFPEFMMPSNAQMFEMANLAYYFAALGKVAPKNEIRQDFKDYLNEKSQYCEKRAKYLKTVYQDNRMAQYEELQAKFLSNPSDDIVDLQALKMQMFYAYRNSFSATDRNNSLDFNVMSTISYFLNAAICARKFANKAYELRDNTQNEELKKYLNFEIDLGQYWISSILEDLSGDKKWYDSDAGLLKWILRNAKLSPKRVNGNVNSGDDLTYKFKCGNRMDFGKVDDISEYIIENPKTYKKGSYIPQINDVKNDFYRLDDKIKGHKKENAPSGVKNNYRYQAMIGHEDEFTNAFSQTFYALDNERTLATFPAAIKALYNAMLLNKEATDMQQEVKNWYDKEYLQKVRDYSYSCVQDLDKIIFKMYDRLLNGIKAYNHAVEHTLYYEGLAEFDIKDCPKYNYQEKMCFRNDKSC